MFAKNYPNHAPLNCEGSWINDVTHRYFFTLYNVESRPHFLVCPSLKNCGSLFKKVPHWRNNLEVTKLFFFIVTPKKYVLLEKNNYTVDCRIRSMPKSELTLVWISVLTLDSFKKRFYIKQSWLFQILGEKNVWEWNQSHLSKIQMPPDFGTLLYMHT